MPTILDMFRHHAGVQAVDRAERRAYEQEIVPDIEAQRGRSTESSVAERVMQAGAQLANQIAQTTQGFRERVAAQTTPVGRATSAASAAYEAEMESQRNVAQQTGRAFDPQAAHEAAVQRGVDAGVAAGGEKPPGWVPPDQRGGGAGGQQQQEPARTLVVLDPYNRFSQPSTAMTPAAAAYYGQQQQATVRPTIGPQVDIGAQVQAALNRAYAYQQRPTTSRTPSTSRIGIGVRPTQTRVSPSVGVSAAVRPTVSVTAAPAPQPRKPSTAFGPADTERGNVYGRNVEIGAPVMDLYSQYGIRAVEREAGRLAAEAEEAMSGMGEELEEATVSDMIVDSQPKPSRTFESDPIREIIGLTFFMGTMAVLAYVATKA